MNFDLIGSPQIKKQQFKSRERNDQYQNNLEDSKSYVHQE